ncbi:MAG: hypothetical protein FWC50_05885 [Planctomycetaceae bacterium]|nr:hypothetical protein [Planctomycetaceae bacterium]
MTDDIDELLRNAELRSELEPYLDESVSRIIMQRIPLRIENEYLAAMLAWEKAPVLPIYRWFEPELHPPLTETLDDESLTAILNKLILKLYENHIVLDFTDHLSDRELYRIICCNILPSSEKRLDDRAGSLHWDCSSRDGSDDPEIWLRYYASDEDRELWAEQSGLLPPEKQIPHHPRNMPQDPF